MSNAPTTTPLLGACGLYCGACNHYRASYPEGKHLIEKAKQEGRNIEGFTCQGCRSDRLYIHPGCLECQIRNCVEAQGILHCGQCGKLPCEQLLAFINDGHIHHLNLDLQVQRLNSLGTDGWIIEQVRRWMCKCGTPYSWYDETCQSCGASLDSVLSDTPMH